MLISGIPGKYNRRRVAIAKHFYARSDNDVKNVFHSCRRAPALSARAPTLALSAYAKAVGPNCDDPLVRRRALEAARAVWEEQQQRLLKPEPNQQEGLPAPADCEAMTAEQPQAPEREAGGSWQLGGGELEPASGTAPAACGGLKERPHHRLSRRPSSAPCEPFGAAISAPSSAAEACGGGTTAGRITPQAPCRPAAAPPPLAASWTAGRWPAVPEPAAPAVGRRAVEARNDVPAGPADAWSWALDRRQRSWTSQASSAAPAADAVGPAAVTVAAAPAAAARLAPPRCSSGMGPAAFNKGSFGTGSGSGGMQSAGGGMQSAGGGDRWGATSPVGPGGTMPPQAVASAARSLSSCDHMSWDPSLPPRSASAPEPPCGGVRPTTPYDRLSDVPYAYGSPPQPSAWGVGGGSSSSNGSGSFPAAPYGAAQDVPWGGSPTHSCTAGSGGDWFRTVAGSSPGACSQHNPDDTAPWGASAQPPLGWSQSGVGLQHQQALAAQPQQRALSYPLSYDPSQRPMQHPGAQHSGGRQSLSGPPTTWYDAPTSAHQPDAAPCTQRARASSLPGPLPWLGAGAALEPPSRANGMQQVVGGPWGPWAAPSLSGPSGFCCVPTGPSGRPPVPGLTDMTGRLLSGFEDAGFAPEVEPLLEPDMLEIWLSMRGE
ncbi:hypothetical protein HYH03_004376 [Edaphochlamys debaryana]|uniref:Uncharacterized protein n=1 Tax=Edaphochlamys debaryana TaxID=47281 RepID=A0A836C3A9_9CHLO|nr:hypothetical protein HYH03_004376 [Edaphochlamys debaryana]|eukprot:KAG2497637.1 hypothetical protein HYH03_004376 [Edaphochlamys debaryana]